MFTEDKSINYIAVDDQGYLYDETYYPYQKKEFNKIGTIVPIHLYEQDNIDKTLNPHPVWKDVAQKGYGIIDNINIPKELELLCRDEGFIPQGYNESQNLAKSIHHAYFSPQEEKEPEDHVTLNYLQDLSNSILSQIPTAQPLINNWVMNTIDIKKYIYDPMDINSKRGPYSYHNDYFGRCLFMAFSYLAKYNPIIGRELLVGKREDFVDFSIEAVDLSPDSNPTEDSPFSRLDDDRIMSFESVPIQQNQIIIMNTLNPMIVHKVNKLRSENDVILLANYAWCKYRELTD